MSTGYDALLRAGAPHVPEGYFYRVKSASTIGTLTVQLRKRRKHFGSQLLGSQTRWLPDRFDEEHTAAVFVAGMCAALVKEHAWESTWGEKFDRELADLRGDHP